MEVEVITRPDGCQIVRHLTPLGAYALSIPHILAERAETHGERVFLAERDESGAWRTLTFAETKARSDSAAMKARGVGLHPLPRGSAPKSLWAQFRIMEPEVRGSRVGR